jgi:RNA ligase (TIGR02306 family)
MKLASIEKVLGKQPIPDADRIELVNVLGWFIVCQKDMFNVGDLVVFIPIDTTVDSTLPYFKHLNKKEGDSRVRIKTAKIRGVYSEGLVISIPEEFRNTTLNEGDNVAELFDVQKYEKEVVIRPNKQGEQKIITFPTHLVSQTDEDNLRSNVKTLQEFEKCDKVYLTMKMDGSSMTLIKNNDEMFICSRRYIVDSDTVMYKYAEREKIFDRLISYNKNVAIQGEFCGPKINGNKLGLLDYKFYVFNVKDIDNNVYLGLDGIREVCHELNFETVPLLSEMSGTELTLDGLQEIANKVEYNISSKKNVPGEGIVIRPVQMVWSHVLHKPLSIKIINQKYKD